MQVLLKIATVDKTSSMREKSLKVISVITNRINTCDFILEGTHTLTAFDELILSNTGETIRYFAGYLTKIKRDVVGVTKVFHCEWQDYTILTDRVIVNEVYEDKTDAYIINDLCTKYLPEIDGSTYVSTGKTNDRIIFNRVTLRQAFNKLAHNSGMDWRLDYSKYLHYFTPETNLAPFGISDDPDLSTTYPCYGLEYTRDATQLINRQIVQGGFYRTADTDFELPANNQTTEFLLPYHLHEVDGETDILVYVNDNTDEAPNWVAQGVGIDHKDTLGGAVDVLHNFEERLLKFGTAPLDLTRAIKVTGRYEVPVIVQARSEESYDDYGRWFDGPIIVDKNIDSRDWAKLEAKAVLAEHAFVKEKGSFYCDYDGLVAGQRISIVNSLRAIDGNYLINKVVTRILGGTQCQYRVSFGKYNPDLVDIILAVKNQVKPFEAKRTDEVLNELFEQAESLGLTEATDRHEDAEPCTGRWLITPPAEDDNEGIHLVHEKLALAEAPARSEATTEDYDWDAAGTKWGFFTWG